MSIDRHGALELMKSYVKILDELRKNEVTRTNNSPTGDYAEWLTTKVLELTLEPNSKAGYDAIDEKTNTKYQIKSRREIGEPAKANRQMGIIRNLGENEFDFLVGIIFDEYYAVKEAYIINQNIIEEYSKYSQHQNGNIFYLFGEVLSDKGTENITDKFK